MVEEELRKRTIYPGVSCNDTLNRQADALERRRRLGTSGRGDEGGETSTPPRVSFLQSEPGPSPASSRSSIHSDEDNFVLEDLEKEIEEQRTLSEPQIRPSDANVTEGFSTQDPVGDIAPAVA